MSMRGPYACTECTLGRCVKALTRCDECEARVKGKKSIPIADVNTYIGENTGVSYNRSTLAKKATIIQDLIGTFADISDIDATYRDSVRKAYIFFMDVGMSGRLK